MRELTIRNMEEVKKRYDTIKSNLSLVFDQIGKEKLMIELDTLEKYIKDPNINLELAIYNSTGEVKVTYRWIGGLSS